MSTPTIADEIERHVRTGDADMEAWAWPGDIGARGLRQRADLRAALVAEVRRLATGRAHEPMPARNGWKLILARCAPTRRLRSAMYSDPPHAGSAG